jgi:hypothetical protein
MKNINWFKYRQYLGYAIDLARIFPIINKQTGLSKPFWGLLSQILELPQLIWLFVLDLEYQFANFLMGLLPTGSTEMCLSALKIFRLETVLQTVLK